MKLPIPTSKQISEARLAAGLTQADAAKLVKLAVRTWRYYESGHRSMRPTDWQVWQAQAAELRNPQKRKRKSYGPQQKPRRRD